MESVGVSVPVIYRHSEIPVGLTLIIDCIIYLQANEITKIIEFYGHELDESYLAMLPHVSSIG